LLTHTLKFRAQESDDLFHVRNLRLKRHAIAQRPRIKPLSQMPTPQMNDLL
jgi:hypothetical protein